MLCRTPFIKEGFPYPCTNCLPCRLQRKRHWTHRILLEAGLYQDNAFVTLTYNDEHLPRLEDGRGTLLKKDVQDFMKRLRRQYEPLTFRYFYVGEYGSTGTQRPHYHMALFNYKSCWRATGSLFKANREGVITCCPQCDLLMKCWGKGWVVSKGIGVQSARYIASYTTKKMTAADDARLSGRYPEFAQPSLRPGLGADAMYDVASTLLGLNLEQNMIDVPKSLRHGGKLWPLAPYLRRKLRKYMGRDERTPDEVMEALLEELRPVQEAAQEMATLHYPNDVKAYGQIYRSMLTAIDDGTVLNMESRERIFKKRETL